MKVVEPGVHHAHADRLHGRRRRAINLDHSTRGIFPSRPAPSSSVPWFTGAPALQESCEGGACAALQYGQCKQTSDIDLKYLTAQSSSDPGARDVDRRQRPLLRVQRVVRPSGRAVDFCRLVWLTDLQICVQVKQFVMLTTLRQGPRTVRVLDCLPLPFHQCRRTGGPWCS